MYTGEKGRLSHRPKARMMLVVCGFSAHLTLAWWEKERGKQVLSETVTKVRVLATQVNKVDPPLSLQLSTKDLGRSGREQIMLVVCVVSAHLVTCKVRESKLKQGSWHRGTSRGPSLTSRGSLLYGPKATSSHSLSKHLHVMAGQGCSGQGRGSKHSETNDTKYMSTGARVGENRVRPHCMDKSGYGHRYEKWTWVFSQKTKEGQDRQQPHRHGDQLIDVISMRCRNTNTLGVKLMNKFM